MFKIGQKVVCKNASGTNGIKTGNIYTVTSKTKCPKCGLLAIGIAEYGSLLTNDTICLCGHLFEDEILFKASRFEPLKYDIILNSEIIKEIILEKLDISIKEFETTKQS